MQPTLDTLSGDICAQSVDLLNKHLAAATGLHAQVKQAHCNVPKRSVIAIQKLFDEVSGDVKNYSDLIPRRANALEGTACGTVQIGADLSVLALYPLGIQDERERIFAISRPLAAFGQSARKSIDQATSF